MYVLSSRLASFQRFPLNSLFLTVIRLNDHELTSVMRSGFHEMRAWLYRIRGLLSVKCNT